MRGVARTAGWRMLAVAAAGATIMAPPTAGAETLRVEGIFAATARDASFLPTIGVDAFEGAAGEELGIAIERQLQELDRTDLPHPRLVPPSLRPDGMLTGRGDMAVDGHDYTETRERCTEKKDGKCVQRVKYRVRCTTRTVRYRVDLRLVRHRDGQLLYDGPKTREDSGSWCEDGGMELNVDGSVNGMVASIAREVRLDLAPHREHYTVRVQEKRDGLPVDVTDRFRQALRLTKTDQAAACRGFAEIDRVVPDQGSTLFNLALCAEADGRYAAAADLYSRARVFAPKAGGDITRGLERVRSLAAGEEDVRRMAAL